MASLSCWKCLRRPGGSPLLATGLHNASTRLALLGVPTTSTPGATTTSPFSTSTPLSVNPPKKKVNIPVGGSKGPKKGSGTGSGRPGAKKTLTIKKKAHVRSGRPPAPGERKAARKRIVLSNNNALEVAGMEEMTTDMLSDEQRVGEVLALPGKVIDQLRAAEAFKITQAWPMFRRPGMLVRREGVQIARLLEEVEVEKRSLSKLVLGEKGIGKSMLLLGAMVAAFMRGWVVINVPNAVELVNGNYEYAPLPNPNSTPSTPTIYTQRSYTSQLLDQIAKSNTTVLSALQTTHQHKLPIPLPPNTSLHRLADLGARDPDIAWPVFQALWKELTSPNRPPLLLTLDGLTHLMKPSTYRNPDFSLVHAHHLALVKLFTECLSGAEKLPNGAAVLVASSHNDPASYAVELAVAEKEDRAAGRELTKRDPWKAFDELAYRCVSPEVVEVLRVKGLDKLEARGLMEYWARSGVLRQRVDEKTVAERWSLAGNGVVGEMEREALYMRI